MSSRSEHFVGTTFLTKIIKNQRKYLELLNAGFSQAPQLSKMSQAHFLIF